MAVWSVPVVSYGAGTLAYLALLAYALARREPAKGRLFSVAALVTALACLADALSLPTVAMGTGWCQLLAQTSMLCWLALLLQYSGLPRASSRWRWHWLLIWLGLSSLVLLSAASALLARLLTALCGMILVEQLFRAYPAARWQVKYLCMGLGLMFAYDFYLYSDALLLRRLDLQFWSVRGALLALCAIPLALALRRQQGGAVRWQLSRQFVCGSVALLGAAIYLLAVSALAWSLRAAGGTWGLLMQSVCLAGALLLLLATLFSGAARAWLKVWIAKHFYRGNYDYRHVWQQLSARLAASERPLRERAIEALAQLLESPAGILWLLEADARYAVAHCWNMSGAELAWSAEQPACQLMAQRGWVLDAKAHGWPQFYCIIPLCFEHRLIGMVGLAPPRVTLALDWERRDLLKIAGVQVASYLAQAEAAEKLSIARQFASVHRMSTFIAHDMKSLTGQLALMLENARRHHTKPEFQRDMLDTVAHSVSRMQALIGKLQARNWQAEPPASPTVLELDTLVPVLIERFRHCTPCPTLQREAAGLRIRAHAELLARVIGHLVQNALDATPADGAVSLCLKRSGAFAILTVRDTGCGMSAQYVEQHLFQPFSSSKPGGMGVGLYESREFAIELGGRLDVESTTGQGSCFSLWLPLQQQFAVA